MSGREKRFRILLAKPGLDGHDVGAKVVARLLMDRGFEVVYTGLKKTPEEIVLRAAEEKADVLGLSILSGSHIPICANVSDLMRDHGLSDLLWIVGGNVPDRDHPRLKELGVDAVFAVGTQLQTIADFIRENAR
jgi:methylmalonyl-CoA mutase C-terminal domain/subunit